MLCPVDQGGSSPRACNAVAPPRSCSGCRNNDQAPVRAPRLRSITPRQHPISRHQPSRGRHQHPAIPAVQPIRDDSHLIGDGHLPRKGSQGMPRPGHPLTAAGHHDPTGGRGPFIDGAGQIAPRGGQGRTPTAHEIQAPGGREAGVRHPSAPGGSGRSAGRDLPGPCIGTRRRNRLTHRSGRRQNR